MAEQHEVAELYNPELYPFRDTSAGHEIDFCLRDLRTYGLRWCGNEVPTALQLLAQNLTPENIARHIAGLRGVTGKTN